MSAQTTIEWTDRTWNPVTGCTKVSPGCDRCYAETFAERFRGTPGHHFERGFDVQVRSDKLTLPLRWRKPSRIFVNSMSDLFHKDVPDEYIARVFAVMALTPRHTYQVLTKRHGRMRSLIGSPAFEGMVDRALLTVPAFSDPRLTGRAWPLPKPGWPLPNVWLGVSVEDQQRADLRVPALLDTPAATRFLSCEPLLGPVNLMQAVSTMGSERGHGLTASYVHTGDCCRQFHGIDWVIVGGESGHGARPMHPYWARSLRDQCTTAKVPFLFKQWGEWSPLKRSFDYVTNDDRCQVLDVRGRLCGRPWFGWKVQAGHERSEVVRRYGKKVAGRTLDGRTWDEFPQGGDSRG